MVNGNLRRPKSRQLPTSGEMSITGIVCLSYVWVVLFQLQTKTFPAFSQTNIVFPSLEKADPTGSVQPEPMFDTENPDGTDWAAMNSH